MAIKDRAGLIALVGGILLFIAWFCPYISITVVDVNIWLWGLQVVKGSAAPFLYSTLLYPAILILILTLSILGTGAMARRREDIKNFGVVWAVCGITIFILNFIPLVTLSLLALHLSFGFYITLFSSLIVIAFGVLAYKG